MEKVGKAVLSYEDLAFAELLAWLVKTKTSPGFFEKITKGTQRAINDLIPKKVHQVITLAIEKMVKGVLLGTSYISPKPMENLSLKDREDKVKRIISFYKKTASAEGAVTGAGGILLGLADFPAFLTIKMKMLFEIAAAYGYEVKEFRERVFLLYVFKLAFSGQDKRNQTVLILENWEQYSIELPQDVTDFDWKDFQLEYRDYMDLAKLAQLIPVIGAGVGAVANFNLTGMLGNTALQCFRLRYFDWQI